MAEIWIKMRHDLATNPKVIAIAAALKVDEDLVVGKLHRMWSWADKFAKHDTDRDCLRIDHVTPARLDKELGIKGFAAQLMRESIDWLQERDDGIEFPRASLHMSSTAKSRALNTRRKQAERESEERQERDTRRAPSATETRQPSRSKRDTGATRGRIENGEGDSPPPKPPPQDAPRTPQDAGGGGGGGDSVPTPASTSQPRAVAAAQSEAATTGCAGTSSRSPDAKALLDTLIGAGVWPSVAETAIDQAGVDLVGAVMSEWGKLPKPTPELLGSRLRELVKPGSDIRKCAEAYVAKIAERKARAEARNLTLVRPDRTAHTAQRTAPKRPARDIVTDAGVPVVPGLTDSPAWDRLISNAPEATS